MFGVDLPVKIAARLWRMGRGERILLCGLLLALALSLFASLSGGLLIQRTGAYQYYGSVTAGWVAAAILVVWATALAESPRLAVTVYGNGSRPGRKDVGDHEYHVGGAIFAVGASVSNIGGKKVSLEPRLVLRDHLTRQKLWECTLVSSLPLPEQWAEDNRVGWYVGKPLPLCPPLLVLERHETRQVRMLFSVDGDTVHRIGVDEHDTVRVFAARSTLKFVDRAMRVSLECQDRGRDSFICVATRLR